MLDKITFKLQFMPDKEPIKKAAVRDYTAAFTCAPSMGAS